MADQSADDPLDTPMTTDDPTSTAALIGVEGMERVIQAEADGVTRRRLARGRWPMTRETIRVAFGE